MKKQNFFIISVCLFIVINYIIIAILYNAFNLNSNNLKTTNTVLGVIINKDINESIIKPIYGEDEYSLGDIKISNNKIKNTDISDIVNIEYYNNDIKNIKNYTLYKNHSVENFYILNSYKNKEDESIIISSLDEYNEFVKSNSIIDSKIYNKSFFDSNNLYINIKNYDDKCTSTKILNTYLANKNLIVEVDYNNDIKCEKRNITKYFIIEDKKDIILDVNLFMNQNRIKYYDSFNSSKDINLYVWRKNKQLYYGILDTINSENNLDLVSYIKSMPLTLEEVASIIKLRFNDAAIKVVSNENLTTEEVNNIKEEIGVEDNEKK